MSVGRQGKTTNWADDVVGTAILQERQSMWGEINGEIVAFDASKQTATIKPLYTPVFNGKKTPMPNLLEVPVRFQRAGGGSAVTFPIKAGDKVALRPKMRSNENYYTGGDDTASDQRSFNLSDMEAYLDGGDSLANPIKNFDPENTNMRFDADGKFGLKGSPDGKVSIDGSEGNLCELIGTFMELVATDQLSIAYGSSAGSGHQLQNRAALLEIANKVKAMTL